MLKEVMIIISLLAVLNISCEKSDTVGNYPKVKVEYGELFMMDTGKCTIQNDDMAYKHDGLTDKIPGLWFGLIKFDCEKIKGTVVSKPECKPCGLYCVQNEHIINCQQLLVPFSIGAIMSLTILVLTTLIVKDKFAKLMDNIISLIISGFYLLKDGKKIKTTRKLVKHGNSSAHPNFNDLPYIKEKHRQALIKKRIDKCGKNNIKVLTPFKKINNTKENDYLELIEINGLSKNTFYPDLTTVEVYTMDNGNHQNDQNSSQRNEPTAPELITRIEDSELPRITAMNTAMLNTIDSMGHASNALSNPNMPTASDITAINNLTKNITRVTEMVKANVDLEKIKDIAKTKEQIEGLKMLTEAINKLGNLEQETSKRIKEDMDKIRMEIEMEKCKLKDEKKNDDDNKDDDNDNGNTTKLPAIGVSKTMIVIVAFLLLPLALACDTTLFMHANGKICDETKCHEVNTYSFPLQTGNTICFDDMNNNIFKINIVKTSNVVHYQKVYRTSDYKLQTLQHSQCAGKGGCWRDSCLLGKLSNDYKRIDGKPTGNDCYWSASGCADNCWHGQRCNYVQWWIDSTGIIYDVYKEVFSVWEVTFRTSYKEIEKTSTLNVNNPSVDLIEFGFNTISKMPLMITSFMSEDIKTDKFIISNGVDFYNVHSSDRNLPQTDIIGDYQIELFSNNSIYNVNDVSCIVEECRTMCRMPESKLTKFINSNAKDDKIVTGFSKTVDDLNVLTSYETRSTINVVIGNVEFNNLRLEHASCQIESVMTYSCKGCQNRQYTVFKAYKIKVPGIMTFTSNCSYNVNYLSCNDEPYKLHNKHQDKLCWIYISKTNQTLYIRADIKDLSTLEPTRMLIDESNFKQLATEIVTSVNFINGIINTVTIYGTITMLMAFGSRIFKLYLSHKAANNIDKGKV